MQVNISGHHIDLTNALKNYVHEKIHRIENHFQNITNVHVTLSTKDHILHAAEGQIFLAGRKDPICARFESKDMYKSIDTIVDKLDKQVKKHKERLKKHGNGKLI